jgi:hypothetical protein
VSAPAPETEVLVTEVAQHVVEAKMIACDALQAQLDQHRQGDNVGFPVTR